MTSSQSNVFLTIQEHMQTGNSQLAYDMLLPLLDAGNIQQIQLLHADVLRSLKKYEEAITVYIQEAEKGGSKAALLWRQAAECYIELKQVDKAVTCVRKSLALNPHDFYAHQLAASLLFTSTLYPQAISHAHILLKYGNDDSHLSLAENIFRFALLPYEAYLAVKRRAEISPNPEYFLGLLVCAAQGILLWKEAEEYEKELEEKYYSKEDYATVREIPLYNIARTMNEKCNLECAKAATADLALLEPAFDMSKRRKNQKIRVGLLSADFASHPVIQLIIGLCEELNKDKFEIYAYDDGKNLHTKENRFSKCVTKHIDVREQKDLAVAEKVYDDNIDILIDLMGITTKNRLGVLALRPSPVTATFLGFPGTTGLSSVDYIITDKIITPDSSIPFFAEKLCRLPEVFMPCDNKRHIASNPVSRKDVDLPEDKIVFCSFNRSFKLDKKTVHLWMRILARVPNSVLWQKADENHMKEAFEIAAKFHNIDPNRIIYAGNTSSGALHIARTSLADIALDTLVYNGHTITTDMLWAHVPVITVKGTHFASRVSASLLESIGLSELICHSEQEMEDLAVHLAENPQLLQNIKEKLQKNLVTYPLFNTERYTRHFEKALELMLEKSETGLKASCIDVPALKPDFTNFLPCGQPYSHESLAGIPHKGDYADMAESQLLQKSPYTIHYGTCPVCDSTPPQIGLPVRVDSNTLWTEPLPHTTFWVTCDNCGHINTNAFWNYEANNILLEKNKKSTFTLEEYTENRKIYLPIINEIYNLTSIHNKKPIWLEAYSQNPSLSILAAEKGFGVNILSLDPSLVELLKNLSLNAWHNDFISSDFTGEANILFFHNNIDTMPYPKMLLNKAKNILKPYGMLALSFHNRNSPIWPLLGINEKNVHIANPYKLHVFSLTHMENLLEENSFKIEKILPDPIIPGNIFLLTRKIN